MGGAGCARTPAVPQLTSSGGVYRSDDGGITFVQRSEVGQDGDLTRAAFREVIAPPAAPGTLFVVTNQGVYRTTTAGERWQRLPVPAREVLSMTAHPNNPRILLVATISSVGGRGRILRSINGGQSWEEAFTAPSTTKVRGSFYRRRVEVPLQVTALARDPHRPQVVLAGTDSGILLTSEDGGSRWRSKRAFRLGVSALKFSPTVPGRLFIRLADGSILRSSDAGDTVQSIRVSRRAATGPEGLGDPAVVRLPKIDLVHALVLLRPRVNGAERILAGTAAGLYVSDDGGDTWAIVPLPPTGGVIDIPVQTVAESLDGTLWAASGFVLLTSNDGGTAWRGREAPARASIRFIVTDPTNARRLYLFLAPPGST